MTDIITTKVVGKGFIQKNKARDAMRRKLAKFYNMSVDFLVATMEDEKTDKKLRVECAKTIISNYNTVVENTSKEKIDQLTKHMLYGGQLSDGDLQTEDEDDTPLLDFDTVVEPS